MSYNMYTIIGLNGLILILAAQRTWYWTELLVYVWVDTMSSAFETVQRSGEQLRSS